MKRTWILIAALAFAGCAPRKAPRKAVASPAPADATWLADLEAWRAERAANLKKPYSWFSVTGLFWLSEGDNSLGSDPESDVVLPSHSSPRRAGTIRLAGGHLTLLPAAGAQLKVSEKPVTGPTRLLQDAAEGGPTVMELGSLQFYVIERAGKLGVRVKDPVSPARKAFDGLEYFDADPQWRFTARLVPYDEPREVEVATVIETTEKMRVPGEVHFSIDGTEYSLEAVQESTESDEVWVIFRDQTAGKETYGPGRYLYATFNEDGTVDLDFNRAYNPPCAFTDFATCPLPRPSNILPLRVEAGELKFEGKRVAASGGGGHH